MHARWRPIPQRLMRTNLVVPPKVGRQSRLQLCDCRIPLGIQVFILLTSPQALHKNVVCALPRRLESSGGNPDRRYSSQPEALGAVQEVTSGLKHSQKRLLSGSQQIVRAVTRSEHRAGLEMSMWEPTRHNIGEGRRRRGSDERCTRRSHRGSGDGTHEIDSRCNKGSLLWCRKATPNPRGPAAARTDDGWVRSTDEAG